MTDTGPTADDIELVRAWIDESERVLVVTGAGISTDSGIPDFRGPQGVWTKNPEAERRSHISNYVTDADWRRQVWKRRAESTAPKPEPNAGHYAIVDLEKRGKLQSVVTQNVDGLHLDAGNSPDKVVEIHGTTRDVKCLDCGERAPIERAIDRVKAGEEDPPCRTCGGILKAATISFGQQLVPEDVMRAELAATMCDLVLAVGTKLSVWPAAGVVPIAKSHGARLVIVNNEPTDMDDLADAILRGSISDILPKLVST